ncbi:hypothetical protein Taro_024627 [Colocasia esculenta]|uniref:Uncharacterized protein n=1 Tax=Colocasia esculenta TaxID=4460 RepID=A0A843VI20_COLES|nr:hypothetical protein [Colocasia esculenta]
MSVCYAKHQESILPRLTSTLGRSSPGPDRAPIAQALDQVLDRSPTLCRTNRFILWLQSFNNKLVVVSTLETALRTFWVNLGQCVDTRSSSVDTRDLPRTLFGLFWDSVSTLDQVVSTLVPFQKKTYRSRVTRKHVSCRICLHLL